VTGDITNSGTDSQYFSALRELKTFRNRVLVVPGSHDYVGWLGTDFSEKRARSFDSPFADSLCIRHAFFDKVPHVTILEEGADGTKVVLIGLNSCKNKGVKDFARGEIGAFQRAKLAEIMDLYQDLPKIVYLHHIPHKAAQSPAMMTLEDHQELSAILKGRCEALAYGHQGDMEDPKNPVGSGKAAPVRVMEVLEIENPEWKGCKDLDANRSVDEQACYRITVSRSNVTAIKDIFPPRPPEPRVNLEPPVTMVPKE
jgi:hypothetical protein